jgi:hypothetical protein
MLRLDDAHGLRPYARSTGRSQMCRTTWGASCASERHPFRGGRGENRVTGTARGGGPHQRFVWRDAQGGRFSWRCSATPEFRSRSSTMISIRRLSGFGGDARLSPGRSPCSADGKPVASSEFIVSGCRFHRKLPSFAAYMCHRSARRFALAAGKLPPRAARLSGAARPRGPGCIRSRMALCGTGGSGR